MGKSTRQFIAAAVFLVIVAVLSGCSSRAVATVNGEKITAGELSQRLEEIKSNLEKQGFDFSGDKGKAFMESLRQETLEQMINTRLMLQEAKKLGPLTPEQVQEIIKPLKEQFSSAEEYQDFLAQIKMSEEEAAYILNLQEQVTRDVAPPAEADIKKYYDEHLEEFSRPEQLQVRHILFFVDEGDKGYPVQHTDAEAREMAEEAIARLKAGKDFAELAREKSEDSGTRADGGLYTFSRDEAVKEFADAAYALKEGEYTADPVKTEYGYHIIKLEKKIPARQDPFEEVRQDIAGLLLEQARQEKFGEFMQQAKDRAEIVNKLAGKE